MKNIIESIYNGEVSPVEQVVSNDDCYHKYIKRQANAFDKLETILTAEEKIIFDDYLQKANDTNSYIYQNLFCQGFKMGEQIVLEALK